MFGSILKHNDIRFRISYTIHIKHTFMLNLTLKTNKSREYLIHYYFLYKITVERFFLSILDVFCKILYIFDYDLRLAIFDPSAIRTFIMYKMYYPLIEREVNI